MLPVLRVVLQLARAEQQDAKKHASTIDSLRRTRRQRVRCSAEGKRSNNCDARKQRARYWAQRCAYRSSARRRVLKAHPTRPHGRRGSRPQRPEHYKQAKRRAAMRQAVRPPQAVPRTRPAPYKRYVKYALAAASGFMALFLICRCVSLREGPVGVHDLATGASSYENTQSKELSKTELKETDDEIACCP